MSKNMCPCCGMYEYSRDVGGYEICPVCWWEDDRQQRNDPDLAGGANDQSLNQARALFAQGLNVMGEPLALHLQTEEINIHLTPETEQRLAVV